MVERYTIWSHDGSPEVTLDMIAGEWVRASDYATLSAEVERLTKEVERLRSGRVKQLEWKHYDNGNAYAYTPFLAYAANTDGTWLFRNGVGTKAGDDLDVAKAAAQADYESRVLSALSPEPSPGEAGEAEVEAALAAWFSDMPPIEEVKAVGGYLGTSYADLCADMRRTLMAARAVR